MLLKYTNQFLFLTLPYHFDRVVFCYQLSKVKFIFMGFGTFLVILCAVQSHSQFLALYHPCCLSCSLARVTSYTQGMGVPGMLSSVRDELASLGLVRSTQLIYLIFLLAPGMSFKRTQNNHLITLCFYFQAPDA